MYKMKVSQEEKIKAVEAYQRGEGSSISWSKKHSVRHSTFQKLVRIYETFGPEGLMGKNKARRYSGDTKQSAVEAYRQGQGANPKYVKDTGFYQQRSCKTGSSCIMVIKDFLSGKAQSIESRTERKYFLWKAQQAK